MRLFPVHSILWSSLLVLRASQSETMEANHPDVCQDEKLIGELNVVNSSVPELDVEDDDLYENFLCLVDSTNVLSCSWSFLTLQEDIQLFVFISICDGKSTVQSLNHSSEGRVGSASVILRDHQMLYVILHFNITLHDKWIVYSYTYTDQMLELLSPPQNISASFKDEGLLVRWSLPHTRVVSNPLCFEYQLDIGDQESLRNLTNKLSYTELNADPQCTYRVRIRTRKVLTCVGSIQWSDWSHTVTVEQSIYTLNIVAILSISLGIPMILLAVLLLVRNQRVSKVLFPPIPRPPLKYKYFLENNDIFKLYPAPSTEPVEEITEVEDTKQNLGKTF